MSKDIHVKCRKCGKKRKASRGQNIIWLKHSKWTPVMRLDNNGKYICDNGYGCSDEKGKYKYLER